jgi:hypothetical protein
MVVGGKSLWSLVESRWSFVVSRSSWSSVVGHVARRLSMVVRVGTLFVSACSRRRIIHDDPTQTLD